MLQRILTIIIIFTGLIKAEATGDLIKKVRRQISQINISLYESTLPEDTAVFHLSHSLKILYDKKEIDQRINSSKDYKKALQKLIDSYKVFEQLYSVKPNADTLKKTFRDVNNNFNSVFGHYFLKELKNSTKQKIICFSTSMSCECTLEMSYQQECEIQKLQKENPDLFEYAVVDSYSNYDLQNEYEIGFIPAVVVLNSNNKEVKRFVRDENLYSELNKYLMENKNGNKI